MLPEETDVKLIQAMAQGDVRALEELYARHGMSLLNYLIGQVGGDLVLAEEILQNVMLAAWNGAPQFRGESKVRTWLIAIARYQALNVRRKNRVTTVPLMDADALDSHKTGPMELLVRDAEAAEVRAALHQLPEEQRETLELIFYHGLTGPEAASILGVSVGTIKSRLHRARTTLKEILSTKKEGRNG